MKYIWIKIVFLILYSTDFFAQSLSTTYLGCNSFSVTYSGMLNGPLVTVIGSLNCNGTLVPRGGESVAGAQYNLEQRDGNGNFFTVTTLQSNATTETFSNLGVGIYRVRMYRRNPSSTRVYQQSAPCGPFIGYKPGTATSFLSPNIEIGYPTVSMTLSPVPNGNPATYCYSAVNDPNEPITLNGSNCFGERDYHIAVFKDNLQGQNAGYASTGWITGKLSTFNLKSLNMAFEPGYKYTVQLALSQLPCTGWVDATTSFTINGSCRESDEEVADVSIFPNPTSNEITFSGLETWGGGDIAVQVMNMMGKTVKTEILQAPNFTTSLVDLPKGAYLVNLRNKENAVTKKVVRL